MATRKMVVLCPVDRMLQGVPGHLLYGIPYLEEEASKQGLPLQVRYLYYTRRGYSRWMLLKLNLLLACRILMIRHDVLYNMIDPDYLFLLALLRRIGLYRKRMFAWKYTAISPTGSRVGDAMKRLFYNQFERLFLMSESHVQRSADGGLVPRERLQYMRWGRDLHYVDAIPASREKPFTFITTGIAYRDFETLCQAFAKVKGARLKILTVRSWGGVDYAAYLDTVHNPDISVIYVDNSKDRAAVVRSLFQQMKQAHVALSICQDVSFGVGYTQILDSLACSLPVIATYNVDSPMDLEQLKVGLTVPAYDAEALAKAMQQMVDDKTLYESYALQARKVVEDQYDIRSVTREIIKVLR